jgi:hypothetical protein
MRYSRLTRFPRWAVAKYCEWTGRDWRPPAGTGFVGLRRLNRFTDAHMMALAWLQVGVTAIKPTSTNSFR